MKKNRQRNKSLQNSCWNRVSIQRKKVQREKKIISVHINNAKAPAVTHKKYKKSKIAKKIDQFNRDRSEQLNNQHKSELSQQVVGGVVSSQRSLRTRESPLKRKKNRFEQHSTILKRCQQSTGHTYWPIFGKLDCFVFFSFLE